MTSALQAFFLRWLPLGAIIVIEIGVLFPLRAPLLGGTEWGGIIALGLFGLSLILLVDHRRLPEVRLRIPNPNGLTISSYLYELLRFAVVIAPIVFMPFRR